MKLKWCALAIVLLSGALAIAGGVIFANEPDNPAIGASAADAYFDDLFGLVEAADDFTLSDDTKVRSVVWWGDYFFGDAPEADDFTISFYEDDGGLPAEEPFVKYHVGNAHRELSGVKWSSGYESFVYRADVPKTEFEGGKKYYISIRNNTDGAGWGWIAANTYEGGPNYYRYEPEGFEWTETFGVEGDEAGWNADFAFALKTNRSSHTDK